MVLLRVPWHILKMPAVSTHIQERGEGDLIVCQVVRRFSLKHQYSNNVRLA